MFCSDAAYAERRAFFTAIFGTPVYEGSINEGDGGHEYKGTKWDRDDGYLFALLKNSDLTDSNERLAHIGFMFDNNAEFDAEIHKRAIDEKQIKVYPNGWRQVFIRDENGVEWEFACTETANR